MAYELAHPVNVRGITLSEASALVKGLAGKSRNWDEFRRNHKNAKKDATDIQKEALALIEGQIESLAVGEGTFKIDLAKDTVLDFSSLDESAKTFYAEIALRQIWESLAMGPVAFAQYGKTNVRLLIAIDELHRLMQVYGEFGIKSVIDTLLRMVRQFGGVYAATQNYTDVPDKLRNLFGTQFVFNTSSESDLDAIRKVEPGYAWVAKELGPYHFIDVIFRTGKEGIFPVFEAEPVEPPETLVAGSTSDMASQPSGIEIDYGALVRERIDKGEVLWVSGLAAQVEAKFGVSKDIAKLKVRAALRKMLDGGDVQVHRLDDPDSGETVSLYFAKSVNENEGPLHKWMINRIVEASDDIVHLASSGEALPDIETAKSYLEVETGLKRRTDDLKERIEKFSKTKPMIVVVPNGDVKETYKTLESVSRASVKTLREFVQNEP